MPLGERAGLGLSTSTRSGLGALLGALERSTTAPAPRVGITLPAPATVEADPAQVIEADWLLEPTSRVLHFATLDPGDAAELVRNRWLDTAGLGPVLLACGRQAHAVAWPDPVSVRQVPRCNGCADTLGYPRGSGAPIEDEACLQRLTERLGVGR